MIIQASPLHYDDIVRIYNQAITAGSQTGDENLISVESKLPWFQQHSGEHYIIYVMVAGSEVLGYLALSPYRYGRSAFNKTAEISYYLDSKHQGVGIGTKLIAHAIKHCSEKKIESLLAILLSCNQPSIAILKKFDFELWGAMPNIAKLKNGNFDHLYYGKKLI